MKKVNPHIQNAFVYAVAIGSVFLASTAIAEPVNADVEHHYSEVVVQTPHTVRVCTEVSDNTDVVDGALVGGLIGAIIGEATGAKDGATVGGVFGAIVGGNEAAKSNNKTKTQCRNETRYEERVETRYSHSTITFVDPITGNETTVRYQR